MELAAAGVELGQTWGVATWSLLADERFACPGSSRVSIPKREYEEELALWNTLQPAKAKHVCWVSQRRSRYCTVPNV